MIKHIVLFNIKSENKDKNTAKVIAELRSLSRKITELVFLEIGTNFSDSPSAYDIILVSHFKSEEDLNIYRKHPEHVKVLKVISPHIKKTAFCDYEI